MKLVNSARMIVVGLSLTAAVRAAAQQPAPPSPARDDPGYDAAHAAAAGWVGDRYRFDRLVRTLAVADARRAIWSKGFTPEATAAMRRAEAALAESERATAGRLRGTLAFFSAAGEEDYPLTAPVTLPVVGVTDAGCVLAWEKRGTVQAEAAYAVKYRMLGNTTHTGRMKGRVILAGSTAEIGDEVPLAGLYYMRSRWPMPMEMEFAPVVEPIRLRLDVDPRNGTGRAPAGASRGGP